MASGGMSFSTQDLSWERVASSVPTGERLTTRVAFHQGPEDIFIAIDRHSRRHILIQLAETDAVEVREHSIRGLSVDTKELRIDAEKYALFIDIACLESQGHAALDTIANELASALRLGASVSRASLVRNVLARWKRFWSAASLGMLSLEAQVGLFGELWFLLNWMLPAVGGARSVSCWRGPLGARNDFEALAIAVEVKTTSSAEHRHRINGIEQLLPPELGQLYLFSIRVRQETSAPNHLPGLVEQARDALRETPEIRNEFEAVLTAAGYSDVFSEEYRKLRLRVRATTLYRVEDGFPRLIPASILGGVPVGVSMLDYTLTMDAAAAWGRAQNPSEGVAFLSAFGAKDATA